MSSASDEGSEQPEADETPEHSTSQSPTTTQPIIQRIECEHSAEPRQERTNPSANPPIKSKAAEWAQVIVSGVLVLITGLILCVYNGQLGQMTKATRAATKANKLSSQTAHIQERAWVSAMTTYHDPIQPNKPFAPTIDIKNTGLSFAMVFKYSVRMVERPRGVIATLAEEKGSMIVHDGGALAPHGEVETHIDANPPNEQQAKRITDGDAILFLLGWTTYYDIFDCVHWTIFSYELDPKDWKWYSSEIGNDADNNKCP